MSAAERRAASLRALEDLERAERARDSRLELDRTVERMPTTYATGHDRHTRQPTLIERFRARDLELGAGVSDDGELKWLVESMDHRAKLREPVELTGTPYLRRIDMGRLPLTGPLKELGWDPAARLEAWFDAGHVLIAALPEGVAARQGVTSRLDDGNRFLIPEAMRQALGLEPTGTVAILADRVRRLVVLEAADRVFARAYPQLYHQHEPATAEPPAVGAVGPATPAREDVA